MADSNVSGLTAQTAVNVDDAVDLFYIWDNSETGQARSKKITVTELKKLVGKGGIQVNVQSSGVGTPIATGELRLNIVALANGEFTEATVLAGQTGSIVFDIYKDTYANYPPTVANTITASAKPTITTAIKSQDTTLTGWTKTFSKGDIFRINVDSVTDIEFATLILPATRN